MMSMPTVTARPNTFPAASRGLSSWSPLRASPWRQRNGSLPPKPSSKWGSGVSAWQAAPVGDAGPIVVTIAVGEDGKLDKLHDPFAGKANELSAVLVESVSRTKSALVTKMGSQNVLVKFKVSAVVSDGTPPEGETLKLSFDSYDPKTKKGGSTFVLGTGRRVTFLVEVLETRALTDAP